MTFQCDCGWQRGPGEEECPQCEKEFPAEFCPHCDRFVAYGTELYECDTCGKELCEHCSKCRTIHSWENPPETLVYHVECFPGYRDPDRAFDEAKDRAAERAAHPRKGNE